MTKSVFTDNYTTFLKILVRSRKAVGMTQTELANKIKENQSYISKYENGERRLDVIEFIEIAKALGVDPLRVIDELVGNWKK